MNTTMLNEDHSTDEIRAELTRICDQFREGLLAAIVPWCASTRAAAPNEVAEDLRRAIEKIKAKDFISVEEAALLFGCSEQHLRNQVQKAMDGTAIRPIPFADIEGVVRFPLIELQEWASLPKPKSRSKHLSVVGK